MPPLETELTSDPREQQIGRYTVKLGAPILDAPIWYVQEAGPLGEAAAPSVVAMCASSRRACRVAAGLAVLDVAHEILIFLGVVAQFNVRQAEASQWIGLVDAAVAFFRKE